VAQATGVTRSALQTATHDKNPRDESESNRPPGRTPHHPTPQRAPVVKLTDFYTEVAGRVDTAKTQINAAETRRVLSEAFMVLHQLPAAEAADLFAKGLAQAAKKSAK